MTSLPIIDLNLGAKILGRDINSARKMLEELVSMLPEDLKKIQAAFSGKDYALLKDLAHYLKGGASYCGTPRLKKAADELDSIIKTSGRQADIQFHYEQLCAEITAVLLEYQKIFAKNAD